MSTGPSSTEGIAGVVLAAGLSRRTGSVDKLLLPVEGEPMVRRVAEVALAGGLEPVVVVIGSDAAEVRAALGDLPVHPTENPDAASGLSSSLRRGLEAVGGPVAGAMILLGDMPWVRAGQVRALMEAFDPQERRAICVPVHGGRRGNPVLWARSFFDEMRALEGDTGARALMARHAGVVHEVPVDDDAIHRDVDTLEALAGTRGEEAPCRR